MSQLYFKKHFHEMIRAGAKTTTIRRWARPMVRTGKNAFSPGVGWLAIDAVDEIQIDSLDDRDAMADGFATATEMRRQLFELYPQHPTDGRTWFRIRFRVYALQEGRRSDAVLSKSSGQKMEGGSPDRT